MMYFTVTCQNDYKTNKPGYTINQTYSGNGYLSLQKNLKTYKIGGFLNG